MGESLDSELSKWKEGREEGRQVGREEGKLVITFWRNLTESRVSIMGYPIG